MIRRVALVRTRLARGSVPLQRSPLRRTGLPSASVRDTGPSTAQRRKVHERSGRLCELALPGCEQQARHASHRLGRKAGGRHGQMRARLNGPAWFLDACPHCHRLITSATEPKLSQYRAAGLLLVEGEDARTRPVQTRHGWVLLNDEGGSRAA